MFGPYFAVLRLGLFADAQYADVDPAGTRFYRESIGKLTAAVNQLNPLDLAFCVNLGDLIDRDERSFDAILAPLKACRHPVYHVLGNHDFEVADEEKSGVPARLGLTRRYYAHEHGAWRFVVLDTTDVSLYAHPASSVPYAKAAARLKALAATGAPNAQTWNSAVGDPQLQWFETTCQAAAQAGQRVIVFAHHPIHPPGNHNAWNAPRLLEALDRHRNVVAWVNGHHHAGAFDVRDGVPFLTVQGMVETRDSNAYAVVDLYRDHLAILGSGRVPAREVALRSLGV